MKHITTLTNTQQNLVKDHLNIIHWAIHNFIKVNESIFGFEYDDLYGEGCIWLCKAATTHDESRGAFATYAQTVVKNGLLSYCRIMCNKQSKQRLLLDPLLPNDLGRFGDLIPSIDNWEDMISSMSTDSVLQSIKLQYSGITLLGIEALELKIHGKSGTEIAKLYGVKPNHVGAWISRAISKLRKDKIILTLANKNIC